MTITVIGTPGPQSHLTIIGTAEPDGYVRRVLVRCDCGVEKVVRLNDITRRDGKHIQCCSRTCAFAYKGKPPVNLKHGMAKRSGTHFLYTAWENIKGRCYNRNDKYFNSYGGRGISMHPEWLEDAAKFASYVDTVLGQRPEGFSLDRIDNDGDYEPGNLRWASPLQQSLNTRRNHYLTAFGETLTLSEWAKRCDRTAVCIGERIRRGVSPEMAVREATQ